MGGGVSRFSVWYAKRLRGLEEVGPGLDFLAFGLDVLVRDVAF